MTTDNAIRDHQTWLNYLQPEGLVVSPAALVDAQVYLDRDVNERQEQLLEFVETVQANDFETIGILDLPSFLTDFLEWPRELIAGLGELPIPDEMIVRLPEFDDTLVPDYVLLDATSDSRPILFVRNVPLATNLDARDAENRSWSASPAQRFERLLRETKVPIGVLTNRREIRLMYAPYGENAGSISFPLSAMTEVAGRPILAAFWMLLRKYRLLSAPSDATLAALLVRSREYQATVSTKLSGQVLDALYELLRGFQSADAATKGALLRELLAKEPDTIYHGLLTVLLRLIFLLYAEDRGLLPTTEVYAKNYSVHGLFTRLRADAQRYPDTMGHRFGAWAQLVALFRAVFAGSNHSMLRMPARKGYLFDPNRYPFLEGQGDHERRLPLISDQIVFRVLENLIILDGERLSYRTLDVEQIGSVYETMMGFRLELTRGRTIALRAAKAHGAPTAINLDELLAAAGENRAKFIADVTENKFTGNVAEAVANAASVDDLLAALERRLARNATPEVLSASMMILQPTDERRKSGSHYTPRSLTEPIVRTALAPVLTRLGENPKPDAILDLKICDIAVGSGAFLVEACRQLGDVLLRAWHAHEELPIIPPDEDEILHARRVIAQKCLYGVDRNPIAVDLTKLSLWLATLAKGHPFTFIDHAIRCGDSLVGLTVQQLAEFHWDREPERVLGQEFIEARIASATTARRVILATGDDYTSPEIKSQKLAVADSSLNPVRQAGDLVVAAFFNGKTTKERAKLRDEYLDQYTRFGREFDPALDPEPIVFSLGCGEHPLRPFHWEIEFPEVFSSSRGGFDAVVGNPPFLGGSRLSTELGAAYESYLKASWPVLVGKIDLVVYFIHRAATLLRRSGAAAFIATYRISDGANALVGLGPLTKQPWMIYWAFKERPWPGVAKTRISMLAFRQSADTKFELDGHAVDHIGCDLRASIDLSRAADLAANANMSFLGAKPDSLGFLLSDEEHAEILASMPDESAAIRRYLIGNDVTKRPLADGSRWIIDFSSVDEPTAQSLFPRCYAIVKERVRPSRMALRRAAYRERWWQYTEPQLRAHEAARKLQRVLGISRVTKYVAWQWIDPRQVIADKVAFIVSDDDLSFGLLHSSFHEYWALRRGGKFGVGGSFSYSPTACFRSFPFPVWTNETRKLVRELAARTGEIRTSIARRDGVGLTEIYNRFHDREYEAPDIKDLRETHVLLDLAVARAYGWPDLEMSRDWQLASGAPDDEEDATEENDDEAWRYAIGDEVRELLLARLLELNLKRVEEELLAGHGSKTSKKNFSRKSKPRRGSAPSDTLFETS